MKEIKIEAYSDICDYCYYCYYRYISDEVLQVRVCTKCGGEYVEHSNFRGIECTYLTEEKEG